MTVRCKCLKEAATLTEAFHLNEEYDLSPERAETLIADGIVELVKKPETERATPKGRRETATTN